MRSVVRTEGRRKKKRRLGQVQMVDRESYAESEMDTKVEMIRALVPLGLMHVGELLEEEVTALAGERYARKEASKRGRRVAGREKTRFSGWRREHAVAGRALRDHGVQPSRYRVPFPALM